MPYETESTEMTTDWSLASPEELKRGYEAMAADADRERDAFEWSEALIGDGFESR